MKFSIVIGTLWILVLSMPLHLLLADEVFRPMRRELHMSDWLFVRKTVMHGELRRWVETLTDNFKLEAKKLGNRLDLFTQPELNMHIDLKY